MHWEMGVKDSQQDVQSIGSDYDAIMKPEGVQVWEETLLDRSTFNRHQTEVFDQAAEHFAADDAVADDVRLRLLEIVRLGMKDSGLRSEARILDVGAGCGVLTGLMLNENPQARITAVDLSEKMLAVLKERFPGVMTVKDDVLNLNSPTDFDSIWFNACFGNLYDPGSVVRHLASQMSYGATLHISHPMGRMFQETLHQRYPESVPHSLPASREEAEELVEGSGLEFVRLINEEKLYLLSFRRGS